MDPNSTSYMYSGQENLIWRLWMKELGIQFVVIDPHDNCTASTMGDKWIAPRPGTDAALAQAIGYVWLTEDTYDHFFVENRTYGFDEWKQYILGEGEDGTPKTPEWAAAICDVPAHTIKALAREWAAKKTMLAVASIFGATGACRQAYATEWTRLCIYLMSMQGFGKPGVNFWGGTGKGAPLDMGFHMFGYSDNGWDAFGTVAEKAYFPEGNTVTQKTYRHLLPDIVMEPPVSWIGEGFCGQSIEQQFRPFTCPEEGPDGAPIKMIHRQGGSFISTMSETNKWVRMYQHPNLEFVVMQDCHWSSETRFGDVILPVSTNFEHSDLSEWGAAGGYGFNDFNSNHRICIYQHKCIEPLWESKPDYEIYTLLAARLGFEQEYTEGNSIEDWNRIVFDKSDLPKYVTYEEFKEKGYFVVPARPDDEEPVVSFRWFYDGTDAAVPSEMRTPPGPPRQRPEPGHPERQGGVRVADPDGVRPGRRGAAAHGPLHPELGGLRHRGPGARSGRCSWSRRTRGSRTTRTTTTRASGWTTSRSTGSRSTATPTGRCGSTRTDAAARGIKHDDLVKVFNDRGAVICAAIVTERMRPGVVHSYEAGAKYDPLEPGKPGSPDRGGCVNLLTPSRMVSKNAPGEAQNSCLVEVARWDG